VAACSGPHISSSDQSIACFIAPPIGLAASAQ